MPLCLRYAFVLPSLQVHFRFAPIDGASTDLKRTYNGPASENVESSRGITLKSVFSLGNGFGMVFTPFLKDYVHIVIDIENNGITVTRAFFRVFQAYRTS